MPQHLTKARRVFQNLPLLIWALSLPLFVQGQDKALALNISIFNESTAIPFTRFLSTPIHPGLQLGTEFNYKTKVQSRLFQTANLSYFYHNYLTQSIGLHTELGYEYTFKNGLAVQGLLGLGYLHSFANAEEFTLSNGQFEKKPDKGDARLAPSLSFDIGYYLKKTKNNSPKIFVRYQSWAEFPYSPGFIPVMTHVNLHIGTKIFIHTKN